MSIPGNVARLMRPRPALPLLAAAAAACATGCGEATIPAHPAATVRTATTTTATGAAAKTPGPAQADPAPGAPAQGASSQVARVDVSSDRVLAEGKVHIASGAASDAEVRREIQAARKAGIVLPRGESVASFEAAQAGAGGAGIEVQTPETAWNPRSKPIADWIVPVLQWASENGWRGTVTSGYRTLYEQAQLNAAGDFSAPAGLSNHETTKYPGGAVDVTEPSRLIEVLRGYRGPLKLVGGVLGPVDPEHFSATGD